MKRRQLSALFASIVLVAGLFVELSQSASALTGSAFQAGNIVSDQVFYDSRTLNAAQIQSFLNAKYSGCAANYVCVRNYSVATPTKAAETGLCSGYTGQASETAAQIIANVSVACGVNPESLLVLLQKESGLITDTTPDYRAVTGYGCPDSTGCDASYYGFFNQVYLAARQFKLYRLHPTNYGYVAGRSNFILYNPNTACGGSQIYIQNQATAGLYDYTPYQPDAAALNNLGGTGDSCGAYGNRNFWVYFNNWFGSTQSTGTPLLGVRADGTAWNYQNNSDINPGGLPYSSGTQAGTGWQQYTTLTTGDLDCDGRPDVLGITADGNLWDLQNVTDSNTQSVSFAKAVQVGSGWTGFRQVIATDLNGDCRADILALRNDNTLWYYPNNMDTNANHVPFSVGIQIGAGWGPYVKLLSADVNGDGPADIVGMRADGTLWYYANGIRTNPAGTSPFVYGAQIGSGWSVYSQLVLHDASGDGTADIIATDSAGVLWLYRNQNTPIPYTSRNQIGSGWLLYPTIL